MNNNSPGPGVSRSLESLAGLIITIIGEDTTFIRLLYDEAGLLCNGLSGCVRSSFEPMSAFLLQAVVVIVMKATAIKT